MHFHTATKLHMNSIKPICILTCYSLLWSFSCVQSPPFPPEKQLLSKNISRQISGNSKKYVGIRLASTFYHQNDRQKCITIWKWKAVRIGADGLYMWLLHVWTNLKCFVVGHRCCRQWWLLALQFHKFHFAFYQKLHTPCNFRFQCNSFKLSHTLKNAWCLSCRTFLVARAAASKQPNAK